MVFWEDHFMEVMDWNVGRRRAENEIEYQKNRSLAAIFLSDLFRCGRNRKQ